MTISLRTNDHLIFYPISKHHEDQVLRLGYRDEKLRVVFDMQYCLSVVRYRMRHSF